MTTTSQAGQAFVQPDSYLTLHYRITIVGGDQADTVFMDTFSGRPATLQMGSGQWAPGLEAALLGRPEGSQFSVQLTAADAYGERNPDLLQRVSTGLIEAHSAPGTVYEPGDVVELLGPDGVRYSGIFKQGGDDWALLDFNHPMAGAALRLDVSLLGVL